MMVSLRSQQKLVALLALFLRLFYCGAAQSPVNITTALVNAGKFINLVGLLQSTGLESPLMQKETSSGITLFAPTDDAFSNLPSGELASLSQPQVTLLLEYHVLPSYFSLSALQAISGPAVVTLASDKNGKPALNITSSSGTVSLGTGVNSALVLSTLVDQSPLAAVYVINAVLLPSTLFPYGPGLTPLATPGATPPEAPAINPSSAAPGVTPPSPAPVSSPSSAAPGVSPLSEAPVPNLAPILGPELAPSPAPHTPAPFFRPFAPPPAMANPNNGPEAGPAASGPNSGVTHPHMRIQMPVITSMAAVLLFPFML